MRRPRSVRRVAFAALALGLVLSGFVAAVRLEEPLAGSTTAADATYADPAGDATNGAPDVTTIRVSDRNRILTFVVAASGIPAPETRVDIYFDVDRNRATGDSDGEEYWLLLDGENLTRRGFRWNGSAWVAWSPSSRQGGYQGGIWTETINTSDLNGTQSFDFRAYGIRLKDDRNFGFDGTARFAYTLGQQPPTTTTTQPPTSKKVAITNLTREPSQAVAGGSFTVSATVARVGWSGRFNGTVYCSTLPGVQTRWFGSVGPGRASCRWDIPANAVGKLAKGSIGVSDGGPVTTRRFNVRVLPRRSILVAGGASAEQPQAGSRFYYALTVFVRSGGSEKRIATGSVDCMAVIDGQRLKVSEEVVLKKEGIRCAWEIPAGTAGRTMTGTVLVRSESATLRHTFTRRVR